MSSANALESLVLLGKKKKKILQLDENLIILDGLFCDKIMGSCKSVCTL